MANKEVFHESINSSFVGRRRLFNRKHQQSISREDDLHNLCGSAAATTITAAESTAATAT
jgi:hypothetical protein